MKMGELYLNHRDDSHVIFKKNFKTKALSGKKVWSEVLCFLVLEEKKGPSFITWIMVWSRKGFENAFDKVKVYYQSGSSL